MLRCVQRLRPSSPISTRATRRRCRALVSTASWASVPVGGATRLSVHCLSFVCPLSALACACMFLSEFGRVVFADMRSVCVRACVCVEVPCGGCPGYTLRKVASVAVVAVGASFLLLQGTQPTSTKHRHVWHARSVLCSHRVPCRSRFGLHWCNHTALGCPPGQSDVGA